MELNLALQKALAEAGQKVVGISDPFYRVLLLTTRGPYWGSVVSEIAYLAASNLDEAVVSMDSHRNINSSARNSGLRRL